jgi:hypothetical protein
MGVELPPTDMQFDFPRAGPSRQVRIASAARPTPEEQAFVRDATSARTSWIALRLMVATCSSLSWPSGRLLRGYTVAISLSLVIAVLSFVAKALGLPDRILSPLMHAGVIGCGHPVLIAAGFAEAIVGRPDYMSGQTDIAWDAVFCCTLLLYVLVLLAIAALQLRDSKQVGLVLLCIAAFYATMGYWVCSTSVS